MNRYRAYNEIRDFTDAEQKAALKIPGGCDVIERRHMTVNELLIAGWKRAADYFADADIQKPERATFGMIANYIRMAAVDVTDEINAAKKVIESGQLSSIDGLHLAVSQERLRYAYWMAAALMDYDSIEGTSEDIARILRDAKEVTYNVRIDLMDRQAERARFEASRDLAKSFDPEVF